MKIYSIHMGLCTSYLIKDEGVILVDAGQQGYGSVFLRRLNQIGLSPGDIRLVFLTHGHWDHIGFLPELRKLAPVPVAIHTAEKSWVEQGLKPMPPPITAWGKVLHKFFVTFMIPKQDFPGTPVDIALGENPYRLDQYGIRGTIYHTPGHSSGSMSLILESGEAFVGDLAVNGFRMRIGPNMSVFADDPETVRESWRLVIQKGGKIIYPAHGAPFEAQILAKLAGK